MKRRILSIIVLFAVVLEFLPVFQAKALEEAEGQLPQISAKSNHSLAVKTDGTLSVWGNCGYGELGSGTTDNRLSPTIIMSKIKAISAGENYSLVLGIDGTLWAWGDNDHGKLGKETAISSSFPLKIMEDVTAIAAGYDNSLAIKNDGTLWAWGSNYYDPFVHDITPDRYSPVKIMDNVKAVSIGQYHSLAIKNDGTLWAWGRNESGQLGDGTRQYRSESSAVKIMDNVKAISAGRYHSFAIKTDGSLWGWGSNKYSVLGDGTSTGNVSPVKIMDNVAAISTETYHSLAIKNDGTLWAWGRNGHGQLGDDTTTDRNSPVKILENVTTIAAASNYSLAVTTDGTLWAWGDNSNGTLGDGTTTERHSPVRIMDVGVVQEKGSIYIYNTNDPGYSLTLPYDSISNITDTTSAITAIKTAASTMTFEQKLSSIGIDNITLFAEEASAQAASKTIQGSKILIKRDYMKDLESIAASTKITAEKTLLSAGIVTNREIRTSAELKISETKNVTITVDTSMANTTLDNVRIETPDYAISIPKEVIKESTIGSPLVITVIENPPSDIVAGSNTTYQIMFNKPITENIKVSLSPITGEPTYQAVVNSDGTAVGGKYNPATGLLEVKTKDSNTYTVKENKKDFIDIQNKSKEMQNAIRVLASKGIIGGTSETNFSPDSTISRAQIAALIVRTLSKLDPNADGGFTDVKKTDWFYGTAGSAKKFGIMNGTSATIFAPNKDITKGQIVAVAARTLRNEMKYKDSSDIVEYLSLYKDYSLLPSWGVVDFTLATRENLVVKRVDGRFDPEGTMTRGDAAIILYRMFNKIW